VPTRTNKHQRKTILKPYRKLGRYTERKFDSTGVNLRSYQQILKSNVYISINLLRVPRLNNNKVPPNFITILIFEAQQLLCIKYRQFNKTHPEDTSILGPRATCLIPYLWITILAILETHQLVLFMSSFFVPGSHRPSCTAT